jgi:hypothetical protein
VPIVCKIAVIHCVVLESQIIRLLHYCILWFLLASDSPRRESLVACSQYDIFTYGTGKIVRKCRRSYLAATVSHGCACAHCSCCAVLKKRFTRAGDANGNAHLKTSQCFCLPAEGTRASYLGRSGPSGQWLRRLGVHELSSSRQRLGTHAARLGKYN